MVEKLHRAHRGFLIFLLILVPVLFLIGWSQASLNLKFIHPHNATETFFLTAVSAFVFVLFVVFALILIRLLLKLYAERRVNKTGAHFKSKMVAAFLVLSVLPVCFLFLFSYGLINRSIDKWFAIPFDAVRQDAAAITRQVAEQSQQEALENARHLADANRLQRQLAANDASGLNRFLQRVSDGLRLEAVVCLDPSGRVIARAGNPELPEAIRLFPQARSGTVPLGGLSQTVEKNGSEYFFAAQRVTGADGAALGTIIAVRRLPLNIQKMADQIQQQAHRYDELSRGKKALKRFYLLILLLITLLILFAATWLAMFFAKQVTVPVQALAEATHAVSEGNLGWRITTRADAELGSLIGLFNEMTRQLQESRLAIEKAANDLQGANRAMEERSNTMEAILGNVPAGVIFFNPQGQITQANSTTERLLGSAQVKAARRLPDLFSQEEARDISRLFRQAARQGVVNRQQNLGLAGRRAFVSLTLSSVSAQHGAVGFVMVIEDLTDVARAQRSEAWREVAQRIAHEIKNPLTPIRLSSGRIQRLIEKSPHGASEPHLLSSITDCASLIEREVSTLERLVDEFSTLARFPVSQPAPSDLNQIIEGALGVFDGRLAAIQVHRDLAPGIPSIRVDPEQIKRAMINLIDNAAEALEKSAFKEIWVRSRVEIEREAVSVIVADSGPGIPFEAKERLFLPYFSTKRRGTGLGLAIVSRIISEHHGSIRVEENWPAGAQFIIELPLEPSGAVSA